MNDIGLFLRENGSSILIVIIGFFTLLTLFSMLGVNFNPVVNKEIKKVVTIEAFNSDNKKENNLPLMNDNDSAFCDMEPDKIHEQCKKLSSKSCALPRCCVLLNGEKCVGGDRFGPTFHTQNGKEHTVNFYHHKTTCHGNCPK